MVVLVQHGKAKSEEEDPERGLKDEGFYETEKVARFLQNILKPSKIFCSMKKRAVQTAEVIAKILGGEIEKLDYINPLDDPKKVLPLCDESQEKVFVIVGHLPHLANLVKELTGSDCVSLKYSSFCALDKIEGKWKILWFITPDIINSSDFHSKFKKNF